MKSLEIVNEHIKFIDDHRGIIKGTPVMLTELEQIKQDLEVLEIIRKKIVNVSILKMLLIGFPLEHVLEMYNEDHIKLTMEELLKLKKWLEENE